MILIAAIRIKNANTVDGYTVIPCWRHSFGYAILQELRPNEKLYIGAEEGFLDHRGKYLSREDAYLHALECGQTSAELRQLKASRNETMLFSEDLY